MREFPLKPGFGFADYLHYLDRNALGAIEAKPEGTLTGVEAQSAKYASGLPDNLPAHCRQLPFLFESNGAVAYLTNGLDRLPCSRPVLKYPRPETLGDRVAQTAQLRARLKKLPPLDESRHWKVQRRAIHNLEESFGKANPRALIQMATGSGKTFIAVNVFEGGAREKVRRNLLQNCRVHTLLRLPSGIWYSPGVKANVNFFNKKERRTEA